MFLNLLQFVPNVKLSILDSWNTEWKVGKPHPKRLWLCFVPSKDRQANIPSISVGLPQDLTLFLVYKSFSNARKRIAAKRKGTDLIVQPKPPWNCTSKTVVPVMHFSRGLPYYFRGEFVYVLVVSIWCLLHGVSFPIAQLFLIDNGGHSPPGHGGI